MLAVSPIRELQGEIGVESTLGNGSLFWFTLRLKQSVKPVSLRHRPAESLAGKKVLVVDDNSTNGRVLHYQLAALDMRDEYASSAERALQMLRTAADTGSPFHLAILDMQMPGMDGLALARIMQSDPDLAGTAKIILTSLGFRLESSVMQEAGIAACLFKPVKEARLFDTLVRVIGESHAVQAVPAPSKMIVAPPSIGPIYGPLQILLAEDNR